MLNSRPHIALTVLRILTGLVFFIHGWQKMFTMGIDGVGGFFGSLGIPAAGLAAAFVTLLELLGGLALILGIGTRVVSLLFVFEMIVAILTVHLPNGFFATNNGIELPLMLIAATAAITLAGPGPYAVDARIFPENSIFRGLQRT